MPWSLPDVFCPVTFFSLSSHPKQARPLSSRLTRSGREGSWGGRLEIGVKRKDTDGSSDRFHRSAPPQVGSLLTFLPKQESKTHPRHAAAFNAHDKFPASLLDYFCPVTKHVLIPMFLTQERYRAGPGSNDTQSTVHALTPRAPRRIDTGGTPGAAGKLFMNFQALWVEVRA